MFSLNSLNLILYALFLIIFVACLPHQGPIWIILILAPLLLWPITKVLLLILLVLLPVLQKLGKAFPLMLLEVFITDGEVLYVDWS